MIKAVLFDMDDTLLDINLTAFLTAYAAEVSQLMSSISGKPTIGFGPALARCYLAMGDPKRADGLTNAEIFAQTFENLTGIPLLDPAISAALIAFEQEVLPKHQGGIVAAKPMEGGIAALEKCQDMGLKIALATNPSFTETCIKVRMGWAGILDEPFERISYMQNSTRLKPKARYYEEFVSALGLSPEECLMVGNDAKRDFPKPDIGMHTAYVGHARPSRAIWSGRMSELADALPAIIDGLNLR